MKNKILELRKNGVSYNEIQKKLGCSKSTISYHCTRNNLSTPIKKIKDDVIENIKNYSEKLTIKDVSKKFNISESTVKKYSISKYKSKKDKNCKNCGVKINKNTFCSSLCSSQYVHKEAYNDFLNYNDKYCKSNYTPKNFKYFFLEEQHNKCDICGCEPTWMNRPLIFVIDHIDGDASNNKRENIRLICPNCDSQTETFKSKTKNSKRRNYWKEKIINDINNKNKES